VAVEGSRHEVDASRAGPAARLSEQGRADGRDETELSTPRGARGRMSERYSMRKIREVLRLKHEFKLSKRKIAGAASPLA
jgi:hypothetical protein